MYEKLTADNIMFDIGSENTVVYRDEEGKCFDVESWQESFVQNCGNVIKDSGIMDVSNGDFRLSDSSVAKEFGFEDIKKAR